MRPNSRPRRRRTAGLTLASLLAPNPIATICARARLSFVAHVWRELPLRGATEAQQKLDAIVNYAGRVAVASSQSAGG